ncbi:MAG: type II toxin-antitoxin system HicA family toxin [Caldilineaceae bacterium]|nr:type II toxin-antitoxin system HicA family toxin [Caldilineaceae bacterium]
MANCQKLLRKARSNPANLRFAEICTLAECYGFQLARVSGSHHIYKYPGRKELINLQAGKGGEAKKYQVNQVLDIIKEIESDEDDSNG